MKKLNKLLFGLPVAILPVLTVTSCNNIDFVKAQQYFTDLWPIMKTAFVQSGHNTDDLEKALNQVASIENAFINNKVNNYWKQTIIDLRYESSSYADQKWKLLFGAAGYEKAKYFDPLKAELQAEGKWFTTGENITDKFDKKIDFIHMIATYNAWTSAKSNYLKDLAGWGGDIAQAALDIKQGKQPESSGFSDDDLYADVDACNIGIIFANWEDAIKTSSLPMYQYYTNLSSDKDRFTSFYNNIWQLNQTITVEQQAETLVYRLRHNSYITLYLSSIGLNWDDDETYIRQATIQTINRVLNRMK